MVVTGLDGRIYVVNACRDEGECIQHLESYDVQTNTWACSINDTFLAVRAEAWPTYRVWNSMKPLWLWAATGAFSSWVGYSTSFPRGTP